MFGWSSEPWAPLITGPFGIALGILLYEVRAFFKERRK